MKQITPLILLLFSASFACIGQNQEKLDYRFKNVFSLIKSEYNQYLLPVKIGNQVMNLLVDSGSNAMLVFADRLLKSNDQIEVTNTKISKGYSSTVRSGRVAKARVQVGSFIADEMRIMVIEDPDSQHDPSLSAKKADGIIGIRRTDGIALSLDNTLLDVPLSVLQPPITMFELNLPKDNSPATLAFNTMPVLHNADPSFLFEAKTLSLLDPVDKLTRSYSDLQVPFRAKTSLGTADDEELDVLLDTGAVSQLVLDRKVAEQLGYDSEADEWPLGEDEFIHFNIRGPYSTLAINPKFRPSEVTVEDYSGVGVEFEAVLGIDRWQNYVIGFSYVTFEDGGPDGTITFLDREDLTAALQVAEEEKVADTRLLNLPGLNTGADESNASASLDAERIAFQSNRTDGRGGLDIYFYERGQGKVRSVPAMNSAFQDSDPSISADGRFVAFHSNRPESTGGEDDYDIYLFDLNKNSFVDLPGLNSEYIDRTPSLAPDGNYLVFRSERPATADDTCFEDQGYCPSRIYAYDIVSKTMVVSDLTSPGSFVGEAYDPSVSAGGEFILFEVLGTDYGDDGTPQSNPFLFDFENGQYVPLPASAGTPATESAVAISSDGRFIAYSSNRHAPDLGLFDRNLVLVNLKTEMELFLPGLNTDHDEHLVQFSPDNKYLVFQSIRPEGKGGKDIYLYQTKEILK